VPWGCKSAEGYAQQADRAVYDIIRLQRDELAVGGDFTIEPMEDTLRLRILSGDTDVEPLDLFDCLAVAAESSRTYQNRRESLYLSALNLTLERWDFSVQETGTFGAFLQGEGNEADTAGGFSDFGITKLFTTGLVMVGNASVDLVRDVSRADGWDAVSNLSMNLTQPLMRGFGEDVVREPLTQAERDVLYEARSYERFRRTFAFDVASRFFSILQQEDVLENERQNQAGLARLLERNEAFAEAGLQNDIQVDQTREQELRARNSVIAAERRLESLLDGFKLFLGLPIDVVIELDPGDQLRLEAWDALDLELTEEEVIDLALRTRLDYLTTLDRVEDAERRAEVAADALRAGLDLEASATATSEEGKPLEFNGDDFDWSIGLDFDAPFDRLPERNTYRSSLIALEAARRDAEEFADTIRTDLRESMRRLDAAERSYQIQITSVALNERRVESSELSLEAGRANTRDVLEAQEDLVAAQNAAASALTEYILSGLALYRDMELVRVEDDSIRIDTTLLTGGEENTP
jgi:outer membrane protein TolC